MDLQVRFLLILFVLFAWKCYFDVFVHRDEQHADQTIFGGTPIPNVWNVNQNEIKVFYKYPLTNSMEVVMDHENGYNSSYYWFMSLKDKFKKIGEEARLKYDQDTPICKPFCYLGPIEVNKSEPKIEWIERRNPDVKLGGYYAPEHCRSQHRVAIIVPYRDRKTNLAIFLRYMHSLLQKQLLEYRIFVIEQYGYEKFNKGTLYNIAFLEIQRFGYWDCMILHDVDLIPEDERIPYTCPKLPTHMSPAVESFGYKLPYVHLFGGVIALTPKQYRTVNGFSNFYWNWGAEDDDFLSRLQSNNFTVFRYDINLARYATLPHTSNAIGKERTMLLMISKIRYKTEGLTTTKYNLLRVTEEKLYTHILADVNPMKMKLDTKTVMLSVMNVYGKTIVYNHQEFKLLNPQKS